MAVRGLEAASASSSRVYMLWTALAGCDGVPLDSQFFGIDKQEPCGGCSSRKLLWYRCGCGSRCGS